MTEIVYYWFPLSPFCYLAGPRLEEVAARTGAAITYTPVQLFRIFAETGTAPVKDRHPSRQAYRLADIGRVATSNGLPVNLKPAHWPTNPVPACTAVIEAQKAGGGDLAALAQGLTRAVWAEERDIADDAVVRACLEAAGFAPDLADKGMLSGSEALEHNTTHALMRGVFGVPTYGVGDELFWGQDRLPHLEAHLRGDG